MLPPNSELTGLLRVAASTEDSVDFDNVWSIVADRLVILTRRMLVHYPRLHRWEETDDIFQTAAIRLHRALRAVKPDSSARFWGLAMTQVRRTLIDLSRHHFGRLGDGTNLVQNTDSRHCDLSEIPDRNQAGREPITLDDWSEFHSAVDQLPEEDREVFQLAWYAAMSQQEIAKTLQVSIPTVQRRLYRSRLLLHELLTRN